MADVKLILTADNTQYIQKVKQAQDATQKLHDASVSGGKREKGILEEIDATLVKLQKARQKAFTYEDIARYNKKIAETKQNLQEYEQAGLKVEKQTESMTQSIGKWAAGLGIAATALNLLKTAMKDTIAGMYIFNAAGAAMKQVLYNIVTGVGNWNQGVAESIALAKQRTDLLLKDRMEMIKAKELMREYNQLYTESIENADDGAKKIENLTKAKEKYQAAIQIEINSTKEQLALALDALKIAPESDSAQLQVAELYGKLQDLLGAQESGIRRISRQIAAEQTKLFADVIKVAKDSQEEIQKILDDIYKEEAELAKKAQEDADRETIKAQQHATDLWVGLQKDNAKKRKDTVGKSETSFWDFIRAKTQNAQEDIGKVLDESVQKEKDLAQQKIDADNDVRNKKIANLEAIAEVANSVSQFTMSLFDNEMTKAEWQADSQLRIADAKYRADINAAGNNAKQKEKIEKQYNDKRYAIELELDKKRKEIARKAAIAEKISGLFSVSINTAVAITKAMGTLNPVLVALTAIAGAAQAALIAAKPVPQFAKGGWTGEGKHKDSTGERVAGVVHEQEFVVKRGPANKFRDVLEAINKDDRSLIINKFNKLSPELLGGTTVNNVVVDNSGSNKRLDQLIQENKKLNAKLSSESVHEYGNQRIIKKGNSTRIIKR